MSALQEQMQAMTMEGQDVCIAGANAGDDHGRWHAASIQATPTCSAAGSQPASLRSNR
jgi:hypothetical protein